MLPRVTGSASESDSDKETPIEEDGTEKEEGDGVSVKAMGQTIAPSTLAMLASRVHMFVSLLLKGGPLPGIPSVLCVLFYHRCLCKVSMKVLILTGE